METNISTPAPVQAGLPTVGHQAGNEEILSDAIRVPYLSLMQGLSELVTDGKAVMGEFIRSSTKEKLGDPEHPIDFIPLTFRNTWVISEKVGQKFEWRRREPLTAANQDLPWEWEENGTEWKRVKSVDVYALLVRDIIAERTEMEKAAVGELPDTDKALLPIIISFTSTSYGTGGKSVVTHFAKAKKFGFGGHVSILQVSARKDKNEKGTYYVMDVTNVGKTPQEYLQVCDYWRNLVAQNRVQSEEPTPDTAKAASDESKF